MFKAEVRTEAWEQRHADARGGAQASAGASRDACRTSPRCLGLSAVAAHCMGRRGRPPLPRHDPPLARRRDHVDSWQLDELGTQLAGPQGRQHREFVRGVLQGITFGRRVLGDSEGKGWVWATRQRAQPRAAPGHRGAARVLAAARARGVPRRRRGVPELRRRSGRAPRERRRTASARSRPAARSGAPSPAATSRA